MTLHDTLDIAEVKLDQNDKLLLVDSFRCCASTL